MMIIMGVIGLVIVGIIASKFGVKRNQETLFVSKFFPYTGKMYFDKVIENFFKLHIR